MTPVTLGNNALQGTYAPVPAPKSGSTPGSITLNGAPETATPPDTVQLSPAALADAALTGRVATNTATGNLTTDQAQQLYSQISTIHSQIATDQQADGGTLSPTDAKAIQQAQSQLSQTVYSDAHNGAAPPSDPNTTGTGRRDSIEAGRIALNEHAGNLSSAQSQQLGSQLSTIQQQIVTDQQANGGTLTPTDAQAINQLQSQLSQQIYNTAHNVPAA